MGLAIFACVFTCTSCDPSAEEVAFQESQIDTASPVKTEAVKQDVSQPPSALPTVLMSTDNICENLGNHTYCLSTELPAPPTTPLTWGAIIGYSPEVFCASDLSTELCGWVTSALLAAIIEWGNYGPVEYWVLGVDVPASENLAEVNCQRREDRKQWNISDCLRKHSDSGNHGFESYRKIGADALESGEPSGDAARSGARDWGIHFFTSSIPLGFTDHFKVPGASDQKIVFHEYFHAVQLAHLSTEDYDRRDETEGPVWFVEGAAEYMAQIASHKARLSGDLEDINSDDRWPFVFDEKMEWFMTNGFEKRRSVCPGIQMKDITYNNSCDGAGYDLGTWAHAYLANRFGDDVLLNTFYPSLDQLKWEETFLKTYGMTTGAFYAEFEEFLDLPLSEQMSILP